MDDSERLPPPITGRDIARIVRRRWPLMLAILTLVPVATLYLTRRMNPVYEAKARLIVESPLAAAAPAGIADLLKGTLSSPLDVEVEKMKARSFSRALVAELGLKASPEEVGARITLTPKSPTPIIEVTARATSGKEAASLANAVTTLYRRMVDNEADDRSGQISRRLAKVTAKLKAERDKAVANREAFARSMGISDPSVTFSARASKTASVRSRLEDLRSKAGVLQTALAETRRQLAALTPRKEIVTSTSLNKNPLLDSIPGDINQKLLERKLLLEDFQENSPEVRRVDAEIAALKEKLSRAQKAAFSDGSKGIGINPDWQAAQSREWNLLQEQQTNARSILEDERQLATLEAEQRQLAAARTEFEKLTQVAARASTLYEEARVAEIRAETARLTKLSNVRVLDSAQVPGAPISPNLRLNLLLALALGTFLAIAMALLAEYFSASGGEPTEAPSEVLPALPTVAGVPLLGSVATATLPQPVRERALPQPSPMSARTLDALREIGYTLAHREPGQGAPVAVLVGTRSDDSTASLASQLAALLLQDGLRVTLIDADRAHPRLHRVFGKPDAPGLAEVLAGRAALERVLHATHDGRFRFLSAGDASDPAPLEEESLRRLLERLAGDGASDLVLVSGPSVWNARAVAPLERAASGLVLVAAPDVPAEESVARARRLLTNGYVPTIRGVVLGEEARVALAATPAKEESP